MREHNVTAKTEFLVGQKNRAVEFHASNGKGKIGTLVVSRASVLWYPGMSAKPIFMSWETFAARLEERTPEQVEAREMLDRVKAAVTEGV